MTANAQRVLTLGVLAAAFGAPGTAAADHARVEHTHTFTTRAPGAPAGRAFTTTYFAATDPAAKPPPLSHVHVELPEGARFDTDAIPQCTATDAQITADGASACEPGSTVGTGELIVDTGFPEPNRMLGTDVTFVNARDALIIVTRERRTGGNVVVRGVVGERTLDIEVPPLPGAPPEGGANRYENVAGPAVSGPRGSYLTTPPACPADGAWVLRTTYTFRGGEQVTAEGRSPCQAGATAQRLTFFRRQHARAGRRGTLRARASSAVRASIEIRRGDRRVHRGGVRLRAGLNRLRLPALPAGRYALSVTPDGGTARSATLTVTSGGGSR